MNIDIENQTDTSFIIQAIDSENRADEVEAKAQNKGKMEIADSECLLRIVKQKNQLIKKILSVLIAMVATIIELALPSGHLHTDIQMFSNGIHTSIMGGSVKLKILKKNIYRGVWCNLIYVESAEKHEYLIIPDVIKGEIKESFYLCNMAFFVAFAIVSIFLGIAIISNVDLLIIFVLLITLLLMGIPFYKMKKKYPILETRILEEINKKIEELNLEKSSS